MHCEKELGRGSAVTEEGVRRGVVVESFSGSYANCQNGATKANRGLT